MGTVLGLSVVVALQLFLFVVGIHGAMVCDQPGVAMAETMREVQMYGAVNSTASSLSPLCAKLKPGIEYVDFVTNPVPASSVEIVGNNTIVRCRSSYIISDDNYSAFPLVFGSGSTSITIVSVSFENCQRPIQFREVEQILLLMCTFSNFSPGGAVEIYNSQKVTVDLCKFTNNTSYGIGTVTYSGNAGAIAIGNNRDIDPSTPYVVEILNSNFSGNRALAYRNFTYDRLYVLFTKLYNQRGGAVACYTTSSAVINVSGCIMEDNTGAIAGGGLYVFADGWNISVAVDDCTFARNTANNGGGVQVTVGTRYSMEQPTKVSVRDSMFVANRGRLIGGGFMVLQIDPEINLNVLEVVNCNFTSNLADVGAAVYLDARFIVRNTVRENRISLESCVFTSNEGDRGIVYLTGLAATFRGVNQFIGNFGTSLRVVDALVVFGGQNIFRFNVPVQNGLSGVLHLSSFGQMMLLENVALEFYNNTGSVGACIVVDNAITGAVFPKQLYNPRCFLQYQDPTSFPSNWNVSVIFEDNSAAVGPLVYASNLDGCLWYDLNNGTAYFSNDYTQFWSFMDVRDNYIIRKPGEQHLSGLTENFVQTAVHSIFLADSTTSGAPGDRVQLRAIALDEFSHETMAFLELSINEEYEERVSKFLPNIIQTTAGEDITFRYLSTEKTGNTSISIKAAFVNNQNVEELTKEFTLIHTECFPGYFLRNERCICEETEQIVFCDPTRQGILLYDGLWGAPPNWSMTLVTHVCPAEYCDCNEQRAEIVDDDIIGCLLQYDDPFRICHPSREGILCGECKNGSGVGMLSNTCRDLEVPQYYWLVPLYLLIVIPLLVAIVRLGVHVPTALRSFIFYVQVSPIATEYLSTRFNLFVGVMKCFGSTLALYMPYDFAFHQGMTALESYGLRYFTPALALIVVPIAVAVRYHSKFLPGVWTVIYLLYVMAVETSASLLYCAKLGEAPSVTVWFFDGTLPCYQGGHLFFTIVALVAFLLLGLMILAVGLAVYYPSLRAMFPKLKRSSKIEECAVVLSSGIKEEYKWWPVFELCSRFIFVLVVIQFAGFLIVPLILTILILCVQLCSHPYKSNIANYTESCVLSLLVVLLADGNLRVTRFPVSRVLWPLLFYTPLAVGCLYAAVFIIHQVWVWAKSRKQYFKRDELTRTSRFSLKSFSTSRKNFTVTQTTVSMFEDRLEDSTSDL